MRLSIMNSKGRYSGLGTVATLVAMAAGAGCSVQSSTTSHELTGSDDAPISVALTSFAAAGTSPQCAGAATVSGTLTCPPIYFKSSTSAVTINMKDETAEVYMNSADSSLMVNGVQVVDTSVTPNVIAIVGGTKANVKTIGIVSSTSGTGDTVILNYTNGLFGLGSASAQATTVSLTATKTNALVIKGTTGNDSFAFGGTAGMAGVPYISLTNSAKVPTRDVAPVNISTYSVFLGAGNDVFTSAGTAATGTTAFGSVHGSPTVSVYGGAGNDTLVEGPGATPGETFSGGAGTDTVDYSARALAITATNATPAGPVYVTVDGTGATMSGAVTVTYANASVGTLAVATLTSGLPTVTENDVILDTDIVLGTGGPDFLSGGPGGMTDPGCTTVTLNGGLGNDTFLESATPNGTDTLVGGGGTDIVDYSLRTASLTVVMDGKTASGDPTPTGTAGCVEADVIGTDVANINLGNAGGTYTGNALNNKFFALAGAAGASTVNGSDGDDTLDEDTAFGGNETFNGGKGIDSVDYSRRTGNLTVVMDGATAGGELAHSEADIIGTDVENLYGGTGTDALSGNDNDNDIEGNSGGDTICGLNGNDTLLGNASLGGAAATLHGSDCGDTINDNGYNLCLNAGTGGLPTTAGASAAGSYCELATY